MPRGDTPPRPLVGESILAFPKEGAPFRTWNETLEICKSLFENLDVDPARAKEILTRQLSKLLDMAAPEHVVEKCRQRLNGAVYVTAWNGDARPENEIDFLWTANHEIYIGYLKGHRRLASRLAKALGYTYKVCD